MLTEESANEQRRKCQLTSNVIQRINQTLTNDRLDYFSNN